MQILAKASSIAAFADEEHYTNGRDGLIKELNNGRLAMLGIMGFVSHSSIPGSVPLLGLTKLVPYEGNFWAPFQADFSLLEAASTAATAAS